MDDADRAEAHEQLLRDIAMRHLKPTLKSCMRCYYCDEKIGRGLLFCSSDCAQDFEQEENIRQIIGATKGRACL